jgi:hypothetical protein
MGHDLKKLWRNFKADFPDPNMNLRRHDKTISTLNKFEEIRYPGNPAIHAMGLTADWFGPAGRVTTYGKLKTPRQYTIVVNDIDDLVADLFKVCSYNPVVFMGYNTHALEAINRHNPHSKFLTTVSPALTDTASEISVRGH